MTSGNPHEIRSVIKFCCELGKTPTNTLKLINTTSLKSSASRSLVFRWHGRFRDGEVSLENKPRGCESKVSSTLIEDVRSAVYRDHRVSIRDICDETGYSRGTVHRMLADHLHMKKVRSRWIPRLLTDVY